MFRTSGYVAEYRVPAVGGRRFATHQPPLTFPMLERHPYHPLAVALHCVPHKTIIACGTSAHKSERPFFPLGF